MRSWRFLLSRRWVLFALTVAALVAGTIWLGNWQFDRLTDRKADNAVVRANETKDPAPVAEILALGRRVADSDEWRLVEATGTSETSCRFTASATAASTASTASSPEIRGSRYVAISKWRPR